MHHGRKEQADQEEAHEAIHARACRDHGQGEARPVMGDGEQGVAGDHIGLGHWYVLEDVSQRVDSEVGVPDERGGEHDGVQGGQGKQEVEHGQALPPEHPGTENYGDEAGDEEGHGQEVDPPLPKGGRHVVR